VGQGRGDVGLHADVRALSAPEPDPPRPLAQRVADARHRLAHDVDAWVATADAAGGTPYLVPLSFLWHDGALLFATPAKSPTGRNIGATGLARVALGPTRDVVLIDGTAEETTVADDVGNVFAERTGFDPRPLAGYAFFRVRPRRVQAWREANELAGRDLMRDGRWLA
jgi:hypothetical protein